MGVEKQNMPESDYKVQYIRGSGKNKKLREQLVNSAPTNEDFNPYDYIDSELYGTGKRGHLAYQEDLAKLLYMAQINQENRMNEYNSPSAQAERLREAGINPDLAGIENMPAQNVAGYNDNPMSGIPTDLQDATDAIGIVASVTSIVGAVTTAAKSVLSFENDQTKSAIDLANSMSSLVKNIPVGSDLSSFFDSMPNHILSDRKKSALKNWYADYVNSSEGLARGYKDDVDFFTSRGNAFKYRLNPLYNQGVFDDPEKELMAYSKVWTKIIDAENEFLLNQLKAGNQKFKYDIGYYPDGSGTTDRNFLINNQGFENRKQSFEKVRMELFEHLRKPIIDTLEDLKEYDNKYIWAPYARSAVGAVMLKYLGL